MNILSLILRFSLIYFIGFSFCSIGYANPNQMLYYRNNDSQIDSALQQTFDYLKECHDSKLDWTTSVPIQSLSKEARLAGMNSFLKDSLHTYYHETLDKNIFESISQYFAKKFIQCNKTDIKLRYTAFDVLSDFYSVLDPNHNLILTVAPTFGYYIQQAAEHNIKIKLIHAKKNNNWKMTPQELDDALLQTRANIFLLTNPVNPTGVYYSKKELENLANILIKHNVFVISDEIFSDIYFEADKPYSIAAIPGMQKRTLTLSGLGKARGVRFSFACSPIPQIPTFPISGILKPIQATAVTALEDSEKNKLFLEKVIKKHKSRILLITTQINLMNEELNKHYKTRNISYIKPFIIPKSTNNFLIAFLGFKGGIFDLNNKINNSLDLAKYLYKVSGVATVPGEGFFIDPHEMVLRIPMSVSESELKTGFQLILHALKEIKTDEKIH